MNLSKPDKFQTNAHGLRQNRQKLSTYIVQTSLQFQKTKIEKSRQLRRFSQSGIKISNLSNYKQYSRKYTLSRMFSRLTNILAQKDWLKEDHQKIHSLALKTLQYLMGNQKQGNSLAVARIAQQLQNVKSKCNKKNQSFFHLLLAYREVNFLQNMLYLETKQAQFMKIYPAAGSQQINNYFKQNQLKISKLRLIKIISEYLSQAQGIINAKQQICRICQRPVQIQFLQLHLYNCQKINKLSNAIAELGTKYQSLLKQLGRLIIEIRLSMKKQKKYEFQQQKGCYLHAFTAKETFKCLKQMQKLRNKLQKYKKKFGVVAFQNQLQPIAEVLKCNINFLPIVAEFQKLYKTRVKIIHMFKGCLLSERKREQNGSQSTLSNYQAKFKGDRVQNVAKLTASYQQWPDNQKLDSEPNQTESTQAHKMQSFPVSCKGKKKILKTRTTFFNQEQNQSELDGHWDKAYYSDCETTQRNDEGIQLHHFKPVCKLRAGSFGKVYLIQQKSTNDYFAMKLLSDSSKNKLQYLHTEHAIFGVIQSDFIVKAPYSFSLGDCHVFLMQYVKGGDLARLLQDEVYLAQDAAKFCIAELVLAIQYLHSLNIIHRDLKPQNIVIQSNGHLKLIDFGLSAFGLKQMAQDSGKLELLTGLRKKTVERTVNSTECRLVGTPDYIPPQIILGRSLDNRTIDWWALGIIAYQLLVGVPPFSAVKASKVFDNILHQEIEWPQIGQDSGKMSTAAQDFIRQLLVRDENARLGANGAEEVKRHPFFKDLDFNSLKTKSSPIQQLLFFDEEAQLRPNLKSIPEEVLRLFEESTPQPKPRPERSMRMVRLDLLKKQTIQKSQAAQGEVRRMRERVNVLVSFRDRLNELG